MIVVIVVNAAIVVRNRDRPRSVDRSRNVVSSKHHGTRPSEGRAMTSRARHSSRINRSNAMRVLRRSGRIKRANVLHKLPRGR